jgi:hypothetical protein
MEKPYIGNRITNIEKPCIEERETLNRKNALSFEPDAKDYRGGFRSSLSPILTAYFRLPENLI